MAEVRGAASNAEHATLDSFVERRILCIVRRNDMQRAGESKSRWVGTLRQCVSITSRCVAHFPSRD